MQRDRQPFLARVYEWADISDARSDSRVTSSRAEKKEKKVWALWQLAS